MSRRTRSAVSALPWRPAMPQSSRTLSTGPSGSSAKKKRSSGGSTAACFAARALRAPMAADGSAMASAKTTRDLHELTSWPLTSTVFARSPQGAGAQDAGKSATRSSRTQVRPSRATIARSPPGAGADTSASDGMPLTPKSCESRSLAPRAAKGRASHSSPMSAKYSANSCSLLSLLTKTSDAAGCAAFSLEKNATSCGVNWRQGGHQWALK
mmetsp:Transcript_6570/g.20866  ORF Transcript_6570/g.20866 Transcript_6570/m.20866 type:complete len:212 (+) Transcript_6570:200-835(+)